MAFYIDIRKVEETADYAVYEFGDDDAGMGRLRITKADGNVSQLDSAPADHSGRRFQRAASKVIEHWKKGELPAETCWAS